MRKMLMAAAAAGLLALGAPAFAGEGPAGTSEGQDNIGTSEEPVYQENNQVDCGDGALAETPNGVQVKGEGGPEGGAIVVCNDGDGAPVQGRVIGSGGPSGGYVAIDGDADNAEQGQGWARVDLGTAPGITCGSVENHETDSVNSPGHQDNCG